MLELASRAIVRKDFDGGGKCKPLIQMCQVDQSLCGSDADPGVDDDSEGRRQFSKDFPQIFPRSLPLVLTHTLLVVRLWKRVCRIRMICSGQGGKETVP